MSFAHSRKHGQPRQLVFVHDSNTFGGMELHMLLLLRYLDRQRYAPGVYVPGYTEKDWATPLRFVDEVQALGIPILRPPHPGFAPGVSTLRDVFHTTKLLRGNHTHLMHIHTNHPRGARKVQVAGKLAGVKAIVRSEHLPPTHFGLTAATRILNPIFDRMTSCLIAGSEACFEEQVAIMRRRNVHLSIYGVELDRFDPQHDVAAAKRKLGLDPAIPVIGAIGRLSELKGHRYFIDAAAQVRQEYDQPVNFLLVGDGPLRQELESQVDRLGLRECFHFAGFQSDTVPFMQATDIATMPTSIDEGISLAMLEYMAMGKPMIATNDPSFEETVVHGQSGLIVAKKDSKGLAQAIMRLLCDRLLVEQLRKESLEIVQKRFNIRRQTDEMMDLYDTLLAQSGD
jgi:glycosyltransferase involved in cell wall biosynthesis